MCGGGYGARGTLAHIVQLCPATTLFLVSYRVISLKVESPGSGPRTIFADRGWGSEALVTACLLAVFCLVGFKPDCAPSAG